MLMFDNKHFEWITDSCSVEDISMTLKQMCINYYGPFPGIRSLRLAFG